MTVRGRDATVARDRAAAAEFAADVQYYLALQPRQLPSRYLYDALGSALFDAICRLPWYRVTRAEQRLLRKYGEELLRLIAPISTVVELGSGSGAKLRTLLERRASVEPVVVHLVDISASALSAAARMVRPLPGVHVRAHRAPYESGLGEAAASFHRSRRALVLLLGSNIGNYDPPGAAAFLRGVRARLRRGDALLLGADLVKPEPELLLAYDDPLGVTAAFNRNLLVRINRELGGDFDLPHFAHRAVWNRAVSRVEMHLVSRRRQQISIADAQLAFEMDIDDTIWTESSYKYEPGGVRQLLEDAGFALREQWIDRRDGFALSLAEAG